MKNYGIKRGYPRLRRYFGKLVDYVALIRPFTLVAPFFVGFFGSLIYLASTHQLSAFPLLWSEIIFVSLTLTLCQAVTPEEAMGLGWLLTLIAIGRAFTINVMFGSWILVILFFALFYNVEPLRVKRYCWLNLTWMSVSRGLLPFVAIWSVWGSPLTLKPWLLGSIAFLWCLAFQNTKDIIDVKGDSEFNIQTLPVRYGLKNTKRIMQILSLFPFIALVLYVQSGLLALPYLLLLSLAILREVNLHYLTKTTDKSENVVGWVGFYVGLSLIYILSFIAEVV